MPQRTRSITRLIGTTWDIIGATLVLIVCVELISQGILHFTGRAEREEDPRIAADAYKGCSWVRTYYDEYARLRAQWHPYTYWQMAPFEGQYINVRADGHRSTPQTARPDGSQPRVLMFGGSAMWGIGARDAYTIPSCVARQLEQDDEPARVENFGEIGYVSTQELLSLLLELRSGNVPDVVVFYDGINDVSSAMYNGVAGIPQNESRRRAEFNLLSLHRSADFDRAQVVRMAERSATVRIARAIKRRVIGEQRASAAMRRANRSDDLPAQVATTYVDNLEFICMLAHRYHFTPLFYLQPVIYERSRPTAYEEVQRRAAEKYRRFFESCYQESATRAAAIDGFRDISNTLAEADTSCFVDFMHTSEAANAIIAHEITHDIEGALARTAH